MSRPMTFKTVRVGDWLVDAHEQICKFVSRDLRARKIETQRYENGEFWDGAAVWTEQSFDNRRFHKTKKPEVLGVIQ